MTPVQTPADLRPITALRFAAALWVAIYAFWENLAGVGLPGLRYGSFLLRNRRRAFCLLIGDDKTLMLPLHAAGKGKESLVLLGPARPQALLEALREEQARRAR